MAFAPLSIARALAGNYTVSPDGAIAGGTTPDGRGWKVVLRPETAAAVSTLLRLQAAGYDDYSPEGERPCDLIPLLIEEGELEEI